MTISSEQDGHQRRADGGEKFDWRFMIATEIEHQDDDDDEGDHQGHHIRDGGDPLAARNAPRPTFAEPRPRDACSSGVRKLMLRSLLHYWQ